MTHVLKDHEQRAALGADSEEAHNVLVLQHGEQLGLTLEVLPGTLGGLLQGLGEGMGTELEGTPIPSQVLLHSNTSPILTRWSSEGHGPAIPPRPLVSP